MANLTPKNFDALVGVSGGAGMLWGAKNIGAFISRSPDFVRDTLAKTEGSPVRRLPGRRDYYAFKSELLEWLKAA